MFVGAHRIDIIFNGLWAYCGVQLDITFLKLEQEMLAIYIDDLWI